MIRDIVEESDYFLKLPNEIIYDTTLRYLTLADISTLCRVNDRFNQIICSNQRFWHQRFILDFKTDFANYKGSWKELYMNAPMLWHMGYDFESKSYNKTTPKQINNFKALDISVGYGHGMIIDLENNVWVFGINNKGELGLGDKYIYNNVLKAMKIENLKAKKVSAGSLHSTIIDLENNLWVFGSNMSGQLGLGDIELKYVTFPKMLPNLKAGTLRCPRRMAENKCQLEAQTP